MDDKVQLALDEDYQGPVWRPRRDHWTPNYWVRVNRLTRTTDLGQAAIAREIRASTIDPLPDDRRIRDHVGTIRAEDATPPWTLTPISPADPAVVMRVIAMQVEEGYTIPLSASLAAWVTAVHRAAPDLGPKSLMWAAVAYQGGRADAARDIDAKLAIGPWRGPAESFAYEAACRSGVVRRVLLPLSSVDAEATIRNKASRGLRRAAGYEVEN